jgi:hypothetical protein
MAATPIPSDTEFQAMVATRLSLLPDDFEDELASPVVAISMGQIGGSSNKVYLLVVATLDQMLANVTWAPTGALLLLRIFATVSDNVIDTLNIDHLTGKPPYGRDLVLNHLNTYIRQHLDEAIADRNRDTGLLRLLATLSSRPVDTTRPHHVVAKMFMQSLRHIANSDGLFGRENFTSFINLVARAGNTSDNGG